MAVSDGRQRGTSLHAAISDMVVRVTADYTGRGATRARTTINGEWIFVTLTDILTKGEHKLAANGRAHFVRSARRGFQDVMRDDFTTEIQALTGRRVTAFLSDNHIDPDVAIDCFQLEPATPDRLAAVRNSSQLGVPSELESAETADARELPGSG
jgi:uncharacterized protein YbcI